MSDWGLSGSLAFDNAMGSGTAGASDWSKILNALSSKEGQSAMGGIGKSLLSASGGSSSNDAQYLRTNAGQAPFSPGGTNSLLNTLLDRKSVV